MVIYHIATGLLVTMFRVTLAALCTLLSMVRMDRNIFIKGFEVLDIGMYRMKMFLSILTILSSVHRAARVTLNIVTSSPVAIW